jgi:glycosyltransferase involved in cell wall biosynthesis
MKVLFNTYNHAFQNPGGGEAILLNSRDALIKQGIQVDLFDKWSTKFKDYDIIHDFSSLGWRDWEGLNSYGAKLVVTPTTWPNISWPTPQIENLKFQTRKILGVDSPEVSIYKAMRIPQMFLPTTVLEKFRIQKRFNLHDDSRFNVVPNAIHPPFDLGEKNRFIEKFQIRDYLLFVGRLNPNKNVHTIIEAAQRTGKNLVIIGDPDLGDEEYALKLSKQASFSVSFIPALPKDSDLLIDAFRGARCLVVASFFETCSLVGMEAGSYGTPVIMTERGATREVYKDLVPYIDPERVETLVNAIHDVWDTGTNEKLRTYLLKHHTWDKIALQLIASYENVLKV